MNKQLDEKAQGQEARAMTERLDPQDPRRGNVKHAIPAHPPDPAAAGETGKVVGPDKPVRDANRSPHVNTAIGSGPVMDHVGGAGLGKPPGESDNGTPATARGRDTRAEDLQDRRVRP
jgi:hypothetical protein